MAVKRNERIYPLALKSVANYPLNAGIVSAYDYADGNGAPHVGTRTLGHNGSPTIVSLNAGEILARDPSEGKTVIKPYNGLTPGPMGFGSADGKGTWSIHRRYRAPSAYSGTSADRGIATYRDASDNVFTFNMVESIANPWCYFYIGMGGAGTVTAPPASTRDSTAAFRIPYGSIVDLYAVRDVDTFKFYLNGTLISTVTAAAFMLYNTTWTGIPSNDGIDAGNPNDLLLIDQTVWNRALTDTEVTQHKSDPYLGYQSTGTAATKPTAPTSPVATAGQGSVSVTATPGTDGGSPITSYTVNVYNASTNALMGSNTGPSLPIVVTGLPASAVYAKVLATNAVGAGPESVASAAVTPTAPPVKPAAPTAPVATPGGNSVSVNATPGSNGGATITSYTVNVYDATTNALLGTASGASLPIVVGSLPIKSVYAKVLATNIVGAGPESVASASVTPVDPSLVPVRFDFTSSYKIAAPVVVLPPEIVSVTVVPANVTLLGGAAQQFAANVQGKNNPDFGVNWTAPAGTVNNAGAYVAPAQTTQEQRILVRATSKQDPSKWGEAEVVVPALVVVLPPVDSVSITPTIVDVAGGGQVTFTAIVTGPRNPSQAGTWSTDLGTIFADGALIAPTATIHPQVGTVTFVSDVDPEKKATAQFVVLAVEAEPVVDFIPSAARTVRILPGRQAFAVGSYWTVGSAGPIGSKDPNSTIDIPFDWSAWLADIGDAPLAKVEFFLGGGLTDEGKVPDAKGGSVFVSGGVVGTLATVTCRITTATSPVRTEDRTVVLQIKDQ